MAESDHQAPSGIEIQVAGQLKPGAWAVRHMQVFLSTIGLMWRNPGSTLLTAAVLGVSLALPVGLFVLLDNVRQVGVGWDGTAQISAFLKPNIDESIGRGVADEITAYRQIESVTLISRLQALEEYRGFSGLGQVVETFETENPLPVVLVINPDPEFSDPAAIEALVTEVGRHPRVDFAQFDLKWLERLYAIIDLLTRGVWVLAGLLALGVILVIGNTIRLEIENRREEIEIMKLIGGTDAFIRRPFLYTGFWYGCLGAMVAALFITVGFGLLDDPVRELSSLYQSSFRLSGLGPGGAAILLSGGSGLGLAGAWLAVGRHLGEIEPR